MSHETPTRNVRAETLLPVNIVYVFLQHFLEQRSHRRAWILRVSEHVWRRISSVDIFREKKHNKKKRNMTKLTFKNPTNWWWQFEQTSTNVKVDVNEMRWNRIMKQKEKLKKSWIWAASRVLEKKLGWCLMIFLHCSTQAAHAVECNCNDNIQHRANIDRYVIAARAATE